MAEPLCACLLAKIHEQIERTDHLIAMVPADRWQWRPPIAEAWSTAEVTAHLTECLAGFCAVLAAAKPGRFAHFQRPRSQPADDFAIYRTFIDEGFAWLQDADLGRLVATVFVPQGESILTLLLGNLEHLINHKHQLFTYLKLMGVEAASGDLYRFRGAIST
jgi:uncharacterized damage-inducible protein DinB